ncbi:unnamed protein product, partial [Durusdinium trenchii]
LSSRTISFDHVLWMARKRLMYWRLSHLEMLRVESRWSTLMYTVTQVPASVLLEAYDLGGRRVQNVVVISSSALPHAALIGFHGGRLCQCIGRRWEEVASTLKDIYCWGIRSNSVSMNAALFALSINSKRLGLR